MDQTGYVSREEFRRWAAEQPRGRFERIDGRVVRMTPERYIHAFLKQNLFDALRDAIQSTGLLAQAMPDGMTVEVDPDTDYEPDAAVNLGAPPGSDDVAIPRPVVVAEVLSPGTRSVDLSEKLGDYFKVASIQHYLVVSARRREVVHHRRDQDRIVSVIVREGDVVLDPPGLAIRVDDIYRGSGL